VTILAARKLDAPATAGAVDADYLFEHVETRGPGSALPTLEKMLSAAPPRENREVAA
jgi:hypothetical protein